MRYCVPVICLLFYCFAFSSTAFSKEAGSKEIKERIEKLKNKLINTQRPDGSWHYSGYSKGFTALALYALKHSGLPNNHRTIVKGLAYIKANWNFYSSVSKEQGYDQYYTPAFIVGLFELLGKEEYKSEIEQITKKLLRMQNSDGGWSYYRKSSDLSSCQFVILALATAERCGIKIPAATKKKARNFWINAQNNDGGWGYRRNSGSYMAMTCAGICSLHLLGKRHLIPTEVCGKYKVDTHIDRGLSRLGEFVKDYKESLNQGYAVTATGRLAYGLYAIERIGILMGMKKFSGADWYKMGAAQAMKIRDVGKEDTAFLLLFLSKLYKSVAIAKWEWNGDWNNDRHDVKNWISAASKELKTEYDWVSAPLNNLSSSAALSSLIFVNGHKKFLASDKEISFLQAFLKQKGTVLGEACCSSHDFEASFKSIMVDKLFPGIKANFKLIPPTHPVYTIKHRVSALDYPIYQLKKGCRQYNLFFLKGDISCALEGEPGISEEKKAAAKKLAVNFLAWAVQNKAPDNLFDNRKLEKVDLKEITLKEKKELYHMKQPFCRLKHRGEYDTDPHFFEELSEELKKIKTMPHFDGESLIKPDSPHIYDTAFIYMSGHHDPALNKVEIANLREYLSSGGFLLSVNCCTSEAYNQGFKKMVKDLFPNDKLEEIPNSDTIWSLPFKVGVSNLDVTPAYKKKFGTKKAPLYGIKRDGRWLLIYSPVDLCCAFEGDLTDDIAAYKKTSALAILANIINYSLKY